MITSAANSTSSSALSRDQFLTLFAKQLQYQDPTSPMDTDNFLQQLAQLSTVEGIEKMSSGIDGLGPKLDTLIEKSSASQDLETLQSINAATNLLGLNVRYGDSPNDIGQVSQIKPDSGNILVRIGDNFYPISDVSGVAYFPEDLAQ